jgi:hypothetical protein
MRAARIFKSRAFTWRANVDPGELGPLLLDDVLQVVAGSGHGQYSVFLFEMMLLCCTDAEDAVDQDGQAQGEEAYEYPVHAWELGPALQRTTPLNLVHAIPTPRLTVLRLSDSGTRRLPQRPR